MTKLSLAKELHDKGTLLREQDFGYIGLIKTL